MDPETRKLLSGVNETAVTIASWPGRDRMSVRVEMSHKQTVSSSPAEASIAQDGEKQMTLTAQFDGCCSFTTC